MLIWKEAVLIEVRVSQAGVAEVVRAEILCAVAGHTRAGCIVLGHKSAVREGDVLYLAVEVPASPADKFNVSGVEADARPAL